MKKSKTKKTKKAVKKIVKKKTSKKVVQKKAKKIAKKSPRKKLVRKQSAVKHKKKLLVKEIVPAMDELEIDGIPMDEKSWAAENEEEDMNNETVGEQDNDGEMDFPIDDSPLVLPEDDFDEDENI